MNNSTPWSRFVGIVAFLFSLWFIWQVRLTIEPKLVLLYCGVWGAFWLLGRNTVVDIFKIIWSNKNG